MRAVWTFWSKPLRASRPIAWGQERHHWLAWVLSVKTASRHYPDTALYTDGPGAELLVEALGLGFAEVSTDLDELESLEPDLWALAKVLTYGRQTAPFLHLDGDVFLWQPLPVRMEQADLLAQNPEPFVVGASHYRPEAFDPARGGPKDLWVPAEWAWYYGDGSGPQRGEACGIFGANRLDLVHEYADLARRFVAHPANRRHLLVLAREHGASNACGLFEEYLLAACIEHRRSHPRAAHDAIRIEYLFPSMAAAFDPARAAAAGYTHLIGSAKRNPELCERLAQRVARDYPEHYAPCLRLESRQRAVTLAAPVRPDPVQTPAVPDQREADWAPPPTTLFVELTRHCNLACPMCRTDRRAHRHEIMSEAVLARVAATLFPTACLVDLRGYGESLLLPSFPQRVQQVAALGLEVRVVSNLSFRAPAALDALAAANARVAISLDTVDAELLSQVRGGARLSHILDNIGALRRAYARDGSDFGRVYLSVTVQRATLGALADLTAVAADLGISDIRLFARIDPGGIFATGPAQRRTLIEDLDACARIAARRGIRMRIGTKLWPGMRDELPPYDFACVRPWSWCVVAWDGTLGFCDFLISPGPGPGFGNVMDPDFERIWNGEPWRDLRRRHRCRSLADSAVAAHCAWCYTNRYVDFEDDRDPRYLPRVLTPEHLVRANRRELRTQPGSDA